MPFLSRRIFFSWLATPALAGLVSPSIATTKHAMEVWKDPQCGCCNDWIAHVREAGFTVTVHESGRTAVRQKLGIPDALASCHTALVGGYAIEGHVPAQDIHKLLQTRPTAIGLTVPGMPIGSPGMDGPAYGGRKDPYDVLLMTASMSAKTPSTRVFTSYR